MIRTTPPFLILVSLLFIQGLHAEVTAKVEAIHLENSYNTDNSEADFHAPQEFSPQQEMGILFRQLIRHEHCSGISLERSHSSLSLLTGNGKYVSCQNGKLDVQNQDTVVKFFYLVNQSGFDVEIRVMADEKELFVKHLKAKPDDSPGITHPPTGRNSTLELKVSMNKHAKKLGVHEQSHLKKCKTFEITETGKESAGFQIIIGKDEITLIQDYSPSR